MIAFEVKDMSCGHCVKAITETVKAADSEADVHIDLATHRVEIEPGTAKTSSFADAIREAGCAPVPA